GSLFLEVREIMAELGANEAEGSVTVDLEAPRAVLMDLGSFPLPDKAELQIGTPFWMAYYDDLENYMYVHSISGDHAAMQGLPGPAAWCLGRAPGLPGESWRSARLLDVEGLEELQVVVQNHSAESRAGALGLFDAATDDVLWRASVVIPARGLQRLRIDPPT